MPRQNAKPDPSLLKIVPRRFGYLFQVYGFRVGPDDPKPDIFVVSSDVCRVTFVIERGPMLMVDVEPLDDQGRRGKRHNVLTIVHAKDPAAGKVDGASAPGGPADAQCEIEAEAARLDVLMREYCDDVLRGDFSLWPVLAQESRRALVEAYGEQWVKDEEEMVRKDPELWGPIRDEEHLKQQLRAVAEETRRRARAQGRPEPGPWAWEKYANGPPAAAADDDEMSRRIERAKEQQEAWRRAETEKPRWLAWLLRLLRRDRA